MQPVSDKFLNALKYSHTVVARAHLYRQRELLMEDIPIIKGSVTDDATALIRRRMDVELPATSELLGMVPAEPPENGGLWPLGNELQIEAGIDFEDGTDPEYLSLGFFGISRPKIDDSDEDITLNISGFDRARLASRNRFITPYTVRAGTNYGTAIRDLLINRLPWLTEDDLEFIDTSYTTPVLNFTNDDDPWEVAVTMAASMGCELYWSVAGKPVMRPEPDTLYTPETYTYAEGEDAIITSISRDLDDEQAYNAVVVSGETTSNSAPIQAVAYDDNPDSPTWYDPRHPDASIYGLVPYFITSQYVTTYDQAFDAAKANLVHHVGIIEKVDFTSVANFAQESNDVARFERARASINNRYILESLRIGIGDDVDMSGTTRKRRALAA